MHEHRVPLLRGAVHADFRGRVRQLVLLDVDLLEHCASAHAAHVPSASSSGWSGVSGGRGHVDSGSTA